MHHDQAEWQHEYEKRGALWIHNGDPERPHALLTSGLHSNGFFNSRLVTVDDILLGEAARSLVEVYVRSGRTLAGIRSVVGPQTGATKLASLLAAEIAKHLNHPCVAVSPAKVVRDGTDAMALTDEERHALYHTCALLCEDVITTGKSAVLAERVALAAEAYVLPSILTLVNRSGNTYVGNKRILALIDRHMPMWPAGECPLCALGSIALRPKDNWAALTGRT